MSDSPAVNMVRILPTRIWIENDFLSGNRAVMLQHEGDEPFRYAIFGYNYRYTSNASTWNEAHRLAISLGATEPVEQQQRPFPQMQTAEQLRVQIAELQNLLATIEKTPARIENERRQ